MRCKSCATWPLYRATSARALSTSVRAWLTSSAETAPRLAPLPSGHGRRSWFASVASATRCSSLVGREGEVGVGHLGDQGELRAAPASSVAKYCCSAAWLRLRTRPNRSSSKAAIAEVGAVALVEQQVVAAGAGQPCRVTADRRHAVGALDAVQRAGPLDIEHRHAQVAVVVERTGDQLSRRGSTKKSRQPMSAAATPARLSLGDGLRGARRDWPLRPGSPAQPRALRLAGWRSRRRTGHQQDRQTRSAAGSDPLAESLRDSCIGSASCARAGSCGPARSRAQTCALRTASARRRRTAG